MDKALKIFGMKFITNHQTTEVEKPGEEPFDFPAFAVTARRTSVLRGRSPVETLVAASMNGGQGGSSLIGSLARLNTANKERASSGQNQKPANEGFPKNDPSGDKTVTDLINNSKNPEV